MVYVTKVTKKGQTSIPQDFREEFGIEEGDQVEWYKEGHRMVVEPKRLVKNPLEELKKLRFKSKKSSVELAQEAEDEFW